MRCDQQKRRWLVPFVVALLIVVGDQVSKVWIVRELGPEPLERAIPLIGQTVQFIYSRNTGVAFNLFPGMSSIFIVTSLLIALGALYVYRFYLPNHCSIIQVSLGLIEGGAIGNTLDRVRVGYVIDFIQVGWWPVFNVADSAITSGAVVLAFYLLLIDGRQQPQHEPTPHDEALLSNLLNKEPGADGGSQADPPPTAEGESTKSAEVS